MPSLQKKPTPMVMASLLRSRVAGFGCALSIGHPLSFCKVHNHVYKCLGVYAQFSKNEAARSTDASTVTKHQAVARHFHPVRISCYTSPPASHGARRRGPG